MELKNILLTTDFSEAARAAYPTAVSLARRFGARVHLAHVAEGASQFYFSTEGFGAAGTKNDYLDDLERHLAGEVESDAFAGVDVTPHLVSDGNLITGLQKLEKDLAADLAVLASHGRSGLRYALLGSSAEKIVRGLACPVLTTRADDGKGEEFNPQKILVPYDFSANAAAVLPLLRFLAQSFTPEVTFFFVVEPIYPFFGEAGYASYDFIHQAIEDAPKLAQAHFEDLKRDEIAGINARLEFGDGVPAAEILARAERDRPDLVLMATHGWTGFQHFLLGSVAETVVRKAPCSVLTVRAPGDGE